MVNERKGFLHAHGFTLPDPNDPDLQRALGRARVRPSVLREMTESTLEKIVESAIAYTGLLTPQDGKESLEALNIVKDMQSTCGFGQAPEESTEDASELKKESVLGNSYKKWCEGTNTPEFLKEPPLPDLTLKDPRTHFGAGEVSEEGDTDTDECINCRRKDAPEAGDGLCMVGFETVHGEHFLVWPENVSLLDCGVNGLRILHPGIKSIIVKENKYEVAERLGDVRVHNHKVLQSHTASFEIDVNQLLHREEE